MNDEDVAVVDRVDIDDELDDDIEEPKDYCVVVHNDDFTTFDVVVFILTEIFHKSKEDAETLTHQVHNEGKAIAGIYCLDIAVTKKRIAENIARSMQMPLKLEVVES